MRGGVVSNDCLVNILKLNYYVILLLKVTKVINGIGEMNHIIRKMKEVVTVITDPVEHHLLEVKMNL